MAWKHLRARTLLLAALCGFFPNSSRGAMTNFNWVASMPSDYGVALNWDRNLVPNNSVNYAVMVTNGGTVLFSSADNALIGQLCLAPSNHSTGSFSMSAGTLVVSNNNTVIPLFLGGYGSGTSTSPNIGNPSTGTLTVSGGSLTIARNVSGVFTKDGFDLGVSTNSSGTLTVSGTGLVTLLCGMEIGVFGTGVVNLYGGTLIDNSWFGIGRGSSGPNGSGYVTITNGTLFLVRNINTESDGSRGFYFCDAGTNGVVNISGGTIYVNRVGFAATSGATEMLNMSGGDFYIGSDGVIGSSAQPVVTISGGVFHTANMVTNGTVITLNGNPYTVGNCDTNSIIPGGTNWSWTTYPSVNLAASIPGMGGVGAVTFAPDAGHTITLNNVWSGNGGLTLNGPGTLQMAGSNTYSGFTTVLQGTLQITGSVNSPVSVSAGATFSGPTSGPAFTMGSGVALSNKSSTPTLGGNINTGSGTLQLTYAAGTPSFTVANGTLALSSQTGVQIYNSGSALAAGNYLLISAGNGGQVTLPGGIPSVTVNGGGIASGQFAYLTVTSNQLYLAVSTNRPPVVANTVTNTLFYGATWQIAISNLATLAGWSDPSGQAIGLSGVGPNSANGVNVFTDGTNIYYNGILTNSDYFNYTITNKTLSAVGSVYLNEIEPTAMMPSDTNFAMSLDGVWRFYFERSNYNLGTPPNVVLPPASQPFQQVSYVEGSGWTNLAVPGDWEMAGLSPATYYVPDDTCGLYRDWIQIPQSWQGRRVYLYLDGVLDGAEIWLNGQPVPVNESSWGIVNYHESGWTGFQVDLTSAAQFGTSNLLAIRVIKSTPSVDLETGDYFVLGGINRPVTLYSVPQTNFADMQVQTVLLSNDTAQVTVTTDVTGGDASTPVSMFLNGVETDTTATNGQAVFTQIVSQPQLWSAEFPNLYPITLELKNPGGQISETVTNRIGIRQITITNGVLLINGVPVKFAGIGDHDSSPTVGSAVDANFWRKEILLMKAANINAIRTTHYPFDSAFYDICDELGMYVSDELPYCWCTPETPQATMTPAFQQRARETIRRDRNHPSVVIWAIGNENGAGNNLQVVADLVKSLEPTRPRLVSTFNASQYNVELSDAHYPSISTMQSDAANAQSTGHPFIFLEQPNTWDERLAPDAGMWEDWGTCMQRVWNVVEQYAVIPGTFPFEWADRAVQDPNPDSSYLQYKSTGVQLLYYFPATGIHLLKMKGAVDAFRNERPNVYEMQMIYSPVQVSNLTTSASSGTVSFNLQNRYSFTDLSYLTTQWQLERNGVTIASGNTNLEMPPLTNGIVSISVPSNALAYADTVRFDFIHPNGNDIYPCQFTLTNIPPSSESLTDLPANLPIPTFNLVVRSNYNKPNYWTECQRFPSTLTNVTLIPANATNLAQFTSLTATVIGGPTGTQVLGQLQAGYTNNNLSYTLTWSGPTWNIQELGWIFQMPTNCDHFSWNRQARWSVYPVTDIGRAAGTALPSSTNMDATDMNITNAFDFNSTKFNCYWATLTAANGQGLRLNFTGNLFHCRAGALTNGSAYLLYANQQVSPPNDYANIVPDLDMTLANGNVVQGSFNIGSNSNLVSGASGSLNGPINVTFPDGSGGATGEGPAQLNFNANPNTSYSIWTSTNLVDWQWEGAATQNNPGQYSFLDSSSTNSSQRFYRVTSP